MLCTEVVSARDAGRNFVYLDRLVSSTSIYANRIGHDDIPPDQQLLSRFLDKGR